MIRTAVLGLPRIGRERELKTALEAYWRGELSDGELQRLARGVRHDDAPRETIARQLALAVADEALGLERAGAAIIQIDEAALREGLPLRRAERLRYLRRAIDSFRLTTAALDDDTQVHAHMCYSEFGEIADEIARLDADVLSIEASRSDMDLLDAFSGYPSQIGPGVYDIHSPRVPAVEEIERLLERAERHIPRERLWVNPDYGVDARPVIFSQ